MIQHYIHQVNFENIMLRKRNFTKGCCLYELSKGKLILRDRKDINGCLGLVLRWEIGNECSWA